VTHEDSKKNTFFQSLRAVCSAFIGIGRGQNLQNDLASLRPQHVIITGVICAALFVIGVVSIVNMVAN